MSRTGKERVAAVEAKRPRGRRVPTINVAGGSAAMTPRLAMLILEIARGDKPPAAGRG